MVNRQWRYLYVANTANHCLGQVWYANGVPDGAVMFVQTYCLTREPLGPEFQDPAYNRMFSLSIFPLLLVANLYWYPGIKAKG